MDLFTDKADLSGITGQPQHRISQVRHNCHNCFLFMGPWLLILVSLSAQLFMVQNSCKEALLNADSIQSILSLLHCINNWVGASY